MKKKIQTFPLFTRKMVSVMACLAIGCMACITGHAQSIVGKWKGVSVTNYYSDDYARQTGKSMEEKLAKETGYSEMDYHADHSFTMTFYMSDVSEATIMKGVWEIKGDQLILTLEPAFNPKKMSTVATYSIHDNTMVTTAVIAPPARIIKTVSTATRL